MHRTCLLSIERCSAVRAPRIAAVDVVLHADWGDAQKPGTDAADRRAVLAHAVLRQPQDSLSPWRESQTNSTIDATDGDRSHLSAAVHHAASRGSQDLSILAAWTQDRPAQPGVVQRYHVCAAAARIPVPGGNYGLVQPLRTGLETFEHIDGRFLFGCIERCARKLSAGDLQQRSGKPVHSHTVYVATGNPRYSDQHGRARSRAGQCVRRAIVARREVRGGVLARVPRWLGSRRSVIALLPFLLSRANPCGTPVPHAGGDVLRMLEAKWPLIETATRKQGKRSSYSAYNARKWCWPTWETWIFRIAVSTSGHLIETNLPRNRRTGEKIKLYPGRGRAAAAAPRPLVWVGGPLSRPKEFHTSHLIACESLSNHWGPSHCALMLGLCA